MNQRGDPRRFLPLTEEQRQLVEGHLKWAYRTAAHYTRKGVEWEAALSGAFEGLIRAAQTWSHELGAYSTYSRAHMAAKIVLAANADDRARMITPRCARRCRGVVREEAVGDSLPGKSALREGVADRERLEAALEELTPLQAETIRQYYFEGWNDSEIAAQRGVSRAAVQQARAMGLARLRLILPEEEAQ